LIPNKRGAYLVVSTQREAGLRISAFSMELVMGTLLESTCDLHSSARGRMLTDTVRYRLNGKHKL